ncbi:hypothetical protein OSH11_21705 [Kaistia dalseonensis]|uniref:Phage tail assembly protein n=1 Tax=Kaistia dalseonensis TaxID=410840 RepID=A0ABU0HCG9_9HYPH|nr:hypothetical protein [Kaistia dalseonensis]MCX5497328.1 hypothetical protein [Kaistia dalseonensis]MDQ0439965.1 hypothetical protein [Kaistia dalseonensis]
MNTSPANIVVDLDDEQPVVHIPAGAAIVDEDADLTSGIPARARRNEGGSITLPLRYPVELTIKSSQGGTRAERYAELTFNRLTGADIRAVQSASKDSQPVVMLARSSRLRPAIMNALFDLMDGGDIADASAIVDSFFGNGRTTGRSSSAG